MDKWKQWQAFLKRNRMTSQQEFAEIIVELADFLMPPVGALVNQLEFDQIWLAGGPWQAEPGY